LGFFLTDHPLNQALERLASRTSHALATLGEEKEGAKIKVGGIIATVKKILTRKSNAEMAFVTLEDNIGYTIECVVFPKIFDEFKFQLTRDTIVVIEGKLDFKDEKPVIIVDSIARLPN
jgi:DNA polymerase-3 subunit alpha